MGKWDLQEWAHDKHEKQMLIHVWAWEGQSVSWVCCTLTAESIAQLHDLAELLPAHCIRQVLRARFCAASSTDDKRVSAGL